MRGVEALAEALSRYTDRQYTVPGFPITDLGELTKAEMAINEKTALEYALGDSLSGRRAAVIIKNVGVNACADPLIQAVTQGLVSGLILVVGDDPEALASQTAQDSRYYGELAEVPVVEPDESTCYSGVETALEASEIFSRVALLRLTPQLLESQVDHNPVPRNDRRGRLSERIWTMNGRVTAAEELYRTMFSWVNTSSLNTWAGEPAGVGAAPGKSRIITVHPPPDKAAGILNIQEYGRPFVRDHRELKPPVPQIKPQSMEERGYYRTFCRDCPFKLMMNIMKGRRMSLICDAGCSILAMSQPYGLGLASYGMGASIAVAARSTHVALIGDYALLHSGLNALIDVYEKEIPLLTVIMKNNCTAMTGMQPVYDPIRYLSFAEPVVCGADEEQTLKKELVVTGRPRTIVVEGNCPKGCCHETVEY